MFYLKNIKKIISVFLLSSIALVSLHAAHQYSEKEIIAYLTTDATFKKAASEGIGRKESWFGDTWTTYAPYIADWYKRTQSSPDRLSNPTNVSMMRSIESITFSKTTTSSGIPEPLATYITSANLDLKGKLTSLILDSLALCKSSDTTDVKNNILTQNVENFLKSTSLTHDEKTAFAAAFRNLNLQNKSLFSLGKIYTLAAVATAGAATTLYSVKDSAASIGSYLLSSRTYAQPSRKEAIVYGPDAAVYITHELTPTKDDRAPITQFTDAVQDKSEKITSIAQTTKAVVKKEATDLWNAPNKTEHIQRATIAAYNATKETATNIRDSIVESDKYLLTRKKLTDALETILNPISILSEINDILFQLTSSDVGFVIQDIICDTQPQDDRLINTQDIPLQMSPIHAATTCLKRIKIVERNLAAYAKNSQLSQVKRDAADVAHKRFIEIQKKLLLFSPTNPELLPKGILNEQDAAALASLLPFTGQMEIGAAQMAENMLAPESGKMKDAADVAVKAVTGHAIAGIPGGVILATIAAGEKKYPGAYKAIQEAIALKLSENTSEDIKKWVKENKTAITALSTYFLYQWLLNPGLLSQVLPEVIPGQALITAAMMAAIQSLNYSDSAKQWIRESFIGKYIISPETIQKANHVYSQWLTPSCNFMLTAAGWIWAPTGGLATNAICWASSEAIWAISALISGPIATAWWAGSSVALSPWYITKFLVSQGINMVRNPFWTAAAITTLGGLGTGLYYAKDTIVNNTPDFVKTAGQAGLTRAQQAGQYTWDTTKAVAGYTWNYCPSMATINQTTSNSWNWSKATAGNAWNWTKTKWQSTPSLHTIQQKHAEFKKDYVGIDDAAQLGYTSATSYLNYLYPTK